MKTTVVDCSPAVHWFFEDEIDADADSIYNALRQEQIAVHVPPLFFLELANTLLAGERRGRCFPHKAEEFLRILLASSIFVDTAAISTIVLRVLQLARVHGLTSYDAAYLELAMRLNASLATRDRELLRAGADAGIELLQRI